MTLCNFNTDTRSLKHCCGNRNVKVTWFLMFCLVSCLIKTLSFWLHTGVDTNLSIDPFYLVEVLINEFAFKWCNPAIRNRLPCNSSILTVDIKRAKLLIWRAMSYHTVFICMILTQGRMILLWQEYVSSYTIILIKISYTAPGFDWRIKRLLTLVTLSLLFIILSNITFWWYR